MKKFSLLFLPLLASFSSFVSACGAHEEENVSAGFNMAGFGIFGGLISTLTIIALVLLIVFLIKKVSK